MSEISDELPTFNRISYMAALTALQTGCSYTLAYEAAASTAIEHPEWDTNEKHTWDEWSKIIGE